MKLTFYTLFAALLCFNTNAQTVSVTGQLLNTAAPVTVSLDIDGGSAITTSTDASGYFATTMNIPDTEGWVHLSYTDCNANTQHSYAMYAPALMSVNFLKDYCPAMNPYYMHVMVSLQNTNGVPVAVTINPNFSVAPYTVTTDADGYASAVIPVLDLLDPIEYSFTDCNGQLQSQHHAQFIDTVDLFSADYCAGGGTPCDSAELFASYDEPTNTFTLTMDSATQSFNGTFTWHFGDGTSSTEPFPSHVYTADELYNVCLVLTGMLGDVCSVCHLIGIDDQGNPVTRVDAGFTLNIVPNGLVTVSMPETIQFNIHPNPVTDNALVQVESPVEVICNVTITNTLGQRIRTLNTTLEPGSNNLQIPLSDLSRGIYNLSLEVNGKRTSRLFVK